MFYNGSGYGELLFDARKSTLRQIELADIRLVKNCSIPDVVGQSEQFFAFTDWYFEKDKEIAEALRPEFEYWLKNKGK